MTILLFSSFSYRGLLLLSCVFLFCTIYGFNETMYSYPFERYVFTGGADGTIRMWDVDQGTCEKIFSGHKKAVELVKVSNDGRYIFSAAADNRVKVWHIRSDKCIKTFKGLVRFIMSIAPSPSGRYLACASNDGILKIWRVNKKKRGDLLFGYQF